MRVNLARLNLNNNFYLKMTNVFLPSRVSSSLKLEAGSETRVHSNFEFLIPGVVPVFRINNTGDNELTVNVIMSTRTLTITNLGITPSISMDPIRTIVPRSISIEYNVIAFDEDITPGKYIFIVDKYPPMMLQFSEVTKILPLNKLGNTSFNIKTLSDSLVNNEIKLLEIDSPFSNIGGYTVTPGSNMLKLDIPKDKLNFPESKQVLHTFVLYITAEKDSEIEIIYDLHQNDDSTFSGPEMQV